MFVDLSLKSFQKILKFYLIFSYLCVLVVEEMKKSKKREKRKKMINRDGCRYLEEYSTWLRITNYNI